MARNPVTLRDTSSARDMAYKRIRNMIRTGVISCGQRIDQRRLAQELQTTTAPLREALSCLESEGLVQRLPGVGIFCKPYTVDEIENLIQIRGVLEGLAAARASGNLTAESKEKLYEYASKITDGSESENDESVIEDHLRFHRFVAELSGSDQLCLLLERNRIIEEVISNISPRYWNQTRHDHIIIADAIASGDPDEAERIVRQHTIPAYADKLSKLREKYGDDPVM